MTQNGQKAITFRSHHKSLFLVYRSIEKEGYMDSVVTPNKTLGYGNDSQRTRKAIQQNATLIILTTTLY